MTALHYHRRPPRRRRKWHCATPRDWDARLVAFVAGMLVASFVLLTLAVWVLHA